MPNKHDLGDVAEGFVAKHFGTLAVGVLGFAFGLCVGMLVA